VDELYIGVMSGTSLDGIDIALCSINANECKLLASHEYPFDETLKTEILNGITGVTTLREVGRLDAKLGVLFASAIENFLDDKKIDAQNIQAIGLHGQTLWHEPKAEFPFSLQLGNANIVVAKTGIKTVADFRNMDIANGGEGAPFAPAFHQLLFGSLEGNIAILNIGGMANITLLQESVKGWDTGCGNVLLDIWIDKSRQKPYDDNGEFARSGEINKELLKSMLNDSYFKKEAPKSTGREYFNESWLSSFLPIFNSIKDEDIQRTLLELTAQSISNDLKNHNITKLIVCGGGSKNVFLMQRLEELNSCSVLPSDAFNVQSDSLEAMAFAWFAYKRIHNEKVKLSSITGAKVDSLLGGIYG